MIFITSFTLILICIVACSIDIYNKIEKIGNENRG